MEDDAARTEPTLVRLRRPPSPADRSASYTKISHSPRSGPSRSEACFTDFQKIIHGELFCSQNAMRLTMELQSSLNYHLGKFCFVYMSGSPKLSSTSRGRCFGVLCIVSALFRNCENETLFCKTLATEKKSIKFGMPRLVWRVENVLGEYNWVPSKHRPPISSRIDTLQYVIEFLVGDSDSYKNVTLAPKKVWGNFRRVGYGVYNEWKCV